MSHSSNSSASGSFVWSQVSVNAGKTFLLDNVSGSAHPGTVTALMGPSGSGKTTLLSVLAQRLQNLGKFDISANVSFKGVPMTKQLLRQFSRFVEQEDHLLGCLTVKESVMFCAKMSETPETKEHTSDAVDRTVNFFGLSKQKNTIVGTPLQKGLSGGQKRRLSVASQVVTRPRVLFLDEPTSGLDSKASFEVIQTLKKFAEAENAVVIASIHQPSSSTFDLFDNVSFLSGGRTVYFGARSAVQDHFARAGYSIPNHYNPAEYILDLTNTDFELDCTKDGLVDFLVDFYEKSLHPTDTHSESSGPNGCESHVSEAVGRVKILRLLNRGFIKARRDYLAYYVRLGMYFCLAVLMGTIWLRLSYTQKNIQLFTNAIFFSGAFMSFMSVAYIPAYLEDYHSFRKEFSNGLYGPFLFLVANFLIGVPFLFTIVILFSIITYFMCHFKLSAHSFFMYVLYLFLNLLAAESLTILIATVFPVFVVALALTAFANGLWMAVGGFLVSASVLNDFWYYTFYWIDYQRYAFQGMMFNQFKNTVYACGEGCHCMYTSALEDQCQIDGAAVLKSLGYGNSDNGLWIGIMILLTFLLRFSTYLVLKWRK